MLKNIFTLSLIVLSLSAYGQTAKEKWVDSVFNTLSTRAKIGQLLMVPMSGYATKNEMDRQKSLVKVYQPGFMWIQRGGPFSSEYTLKQLQRSSKVPIIVAAKANLGIGQTLDSLSLFPPPLVIAATTNDSLVVELGKTIGRQMRKLGVHMCLGPQADIPEDLSAHDTILNSFGADFNNVPSKTVALTKGLQQEGILVCATHSETKFSEDIDQSIADTVSFLPFRQLIMPG